MQTSCPQCKTTFPINLAQLRAGSGTVQCGKCLLNFNALQALYESDDSKDETVDLSSPPLIPLLQEEKESTTASHNESELGELFLSDELEESSLVDELEESPLVDELEESPLVDEPEKSPLVDELEESPLVDELEESPLVDELEESPLVDELEESPLVDELEESPLVDELEESPLVDELEESPLVDEPEESSLVDELEESPLVDEPEESSLADEPEEPAAPSDVGVPPIIAEATETSPAPEIKEPAAIAPWEAEKNRINWLHQFLWLLVSIPTLLLLGGQFYLNEAKHNFPDPTARAAFEVACEQLNKIGKATCELPPIRKVSSIDVVDRSFQTLKDQLLLKITLVNHSTHDQPLPSLKLTLSNIRNEAIAQRLFEPYEYLLDSDTPKVMVVDSPIELQLAIKPLEEKVSAFSFELL